MNPGAPLDLASFLSAANVGALARWWSWLLLLGVAFAPVGRALFPRSLDGGYTAGKLLAVAVLAYAVWLGALLDLVRVTQTGVLLGTLALAVPILLCVRRAPRAPVSGSLRWIVSSEVLFLVALVACGLLRAINPALATTEKFMDFGFVNAILHAPALPPPDPWYAGEPINYYYFGHFVTAVLVAATGVAPAVGYNLMVATIFASVFTLAHALVADACARTETLGRRWALGAGLAAGLLLCASGNLHALVFGVLGSPPAGADGVGEPYLYAQATRFVETSPPTGEHLITEFPAYSFAVADLHAHLLNLPFVLVFLWILFHTHTDAASPRWRTLARGGLLGFLLGVFWMTNSWDAAIYGGLLAALRLSEVASQPSPRRLGVGLATLGAIAGVALLVSLPFTLGFRPFGRGLGFVDVRTPAWQLLVLYGWQSVLAAGYLAWLAVRRHARCRTDAFFVLVLACSAVCVLIPEVIYLDDGLPYPHRRTNTLFKFGYEAFVLLTLAAAFGGTRLLHAARGTRRAALAGVLASIGASALVFAVFAVRGELSHRMGGDVTLDGLALMRVRNPEDTAMVRWLDEHGRDGGYILEAEGQSFTYVGRMSVLTGIPTLLGWTPHEVLWRPHSRWRERRRDAERIYTGESGALEALQRYGVRHVVIGELERIRYAGLDIEAVSGLGEVAFRAGGSRIVRIAPPPAAP